MKTLGTVTVLVLAFAVVALPAAAQSLYSAAGLGLPSDPIDARARALGSFGIGLWGSSVQPVDPGAVGMSRLPTATIVAQPSWVEFDRGPEDSGSFRGNRFPMLGIGYPFQDGLASVTVSSVFDQRYRAERGTTVTLGGSDSPALETFGQEGSLSHLTFGYARAFMNDALGVGVVGGRYAGSVTRRFTRDFRQGDSTSTATTYQETGTWTYSGWTASVGAAADLGSTLRLAASATWSQKLMASASSETKGPDRTYDVPLQYRGGMSLILSRGLRVAASAVLADWSAAADNLPNDVVAGRVLGYGAGTEISAFRILGRATPLRLGYRSMPLPFAFIHPSASDASDAEGASSGRERTFAAGLGFLLAGSEEATLATADLAIERGRRADAILTENFWRATVSVSVSGF